MPESFYFLSKKYLEVAIDEIISIARTYDKFTKAQTFSNLVIIQSNTPWDKIVKRASFVKIAGRVIGNLSNLFLDEYSFSNLVNADSFACRVINLSSKKVNRFELERSLGKMISKFSDAKVSLENPTIRIFLFITHTKSFFGVSTRFEKLKRPKKIVNHPHELDWRLSRAMINLAGLKEGEIICDPFCGTGTTLLEAESMGISSIGIDFDEKMYQICKQNMNANGYKPKIIKADYKYLNQISKTYDGLISDLPYGIASKSSENPLKLIQNFLSIIPPKKKLVIMCKKDFEKGISLKLTKKYEIYRHKNLTRMILVK